MARYRKTIDEIKASDDMQEADISKAGAVWRHKGRERLARLGAAGIVIVAGATLRLTGYEAGLPYGLVKYGGSLLWGVMVYLLVSAALPGRPRWQLALSATAAILVELFRLYHTPWLDAFRLTLAGALLFGRIFSVWNIVAYLAGILLVAMADRWRSRHKAS